MPIRCNCHEGRSVIMWLGFSACCILAAAYFSLTRPKPEDLPEGASVGDIAGRFFRLRPRDLGRPGRKIALVRWRNSVPPDVAASTLVPETRLWALRGAEGVSFGATRFGTGE